MISITLDIQGLDLTLDPDFVFISLQGDLKATQTATVLIVLDVGGILVSTEDLSSHRSRLTYSSRSRTQTSDVLFVTEVLMRVNVEKHYLLLCLI